jgi:hypothetical protein
MWSVLELAFLIVIVIIIAATLVLYVLGGTKCQSMHTRTKMFVECMK